MATTYKVLGQVSTGSARTYNTISNKALTSNVATLTTGATHSYAIGDVVTVAGVDTTFDGTYVVASVPTTTTFTYAKTASNVTSAAVSPVGIVTRIPSTSGVAVSNKYLKNNTAMLTATSHGLAVHDWVNVTVGDSTLDGFWEVTGVPSANLFTYTASGADIASTACGGAFGKRNSTTTVYTVPSATQSICSTLTICNRDNATAYYDIVVRPAGATLEDKHYITFDAIVGPDDTITLTLGIALSATDVVQIIASSPNLSVTMFGNEIA
jgi:hypothetical protein